MAIWQFSVEFIPKENLIKYFGKIPNAMNEEIYWKESFAEGVKLPENYDDFLSSLGNKEKLKWTKASYNWGDYDNGTHISINLQDKNEITVHARFHAGEFEENFVKTVLEFAKLCECVLLANERTIFEPEFNLFIDELKRSRAYRFCKNPVEYLQSDEVKQLNDEIKKRFTDNEFNFNS